MKRNGGVEDPPEAEMHYGKKLGYEMKYAFQRIGERHVPYSL